MSVITSLPGFIKKLETMNGPIKYGLTNDFMFHMVFQSSEIALRDLLCSILGLRPPDIKKIRIMNPIKYGSSAVKKRMELDINILLNDDTVIDLEMQAFMKDYWPDRSLSYMGRSFANLNKGENYKNTPTVIHIVIMDYTPFPEEPAFFSEYRLENVKTHRIYSDKFRIYVIDLTKRESADKTHRNKKLYHWAKLFKAKSWEEAAMIAEKDKALSEAAGAMLYFNEDFWAQKEAMDRAFFHADKLKQRAEKAKLKAELRKALQEKDAAIREKQKKDAENARLKEEIARLRKL